MPGFLFDTHCHVDLYPDPLEVVRQVERTRTYVIAVTNTPSVFEATQRIAGASKYVRPALGLHPELAVERRGELPLFARLLPQTRYVGEIGLDFVTNDAQTRRTQQLVFNQILEWCSVSGDKILTLHSRRAEKEVIDALGTRFRGKAILHWYSGSLSLVEKALANGLYFSINPAMIRSKRFSELLKLLPRHRLLLESDGPFVQVGQRSAQPTDMVEILKFLSDSWMVDITAVVETLSSNFRQLLS